MCEEFGCVRGGLRRLKDLNIHPVSGTVPRAPLRTKAGEGSGTAIRRLGVAQGKLEIVGDRDYLPPPPGPRRNLERATTKAQEYYNRLCQEAADRERRPESAR